MVSPSVGYLSITLAKIPRATEHPAPIPYITPFLTFPYERATPDMNELRAPDIDVAAWISVLH
jgi:hypothetical protein